MKSRKKYFLYFLFLSVIPVSCPAQFNTVQKQPQVVKSKPVLVQRRYDPKKDKDYYAFLKRIGYAENMDSYNAKIRAIANTL